MARVQTTDGTLVRATINDAPMTLEQAEADAERRNARAEKLGIKTRYEAVDLGQEAKAT